MQISRRKTDSGVVMVAVIIFVLVISIVLMGLLSRTTSQTVSIEKQVQYLQAEELRKGGFWYAHAYLINGDPLPANVSVNLDGRNFTLRFNRSGSNVMTNVAY